MLEGSQHAERVDDWLREMPNDLALDELLGRFELMFGAVWRRAHQTLGEVTLTAILDRVLYLAQEDFPLVSDFEIEANGLRCRKLLGRSREFQHEQVVAALRYVTVEFLTLLGNLTAEILTPALHAELATVSEQPRPTRRKNTDDERSKS